MLTLKTRSLSLSVIVILLRCTIRYVIKNSNAGCVDEKLNVLTPHQLLHQEIPFSVSHVTTQDGQQIPYGLHILLESMKKQYIKMVQQMQSREYKENIETQIARERERKDQLTKRVKQLENQIDNLIQDSLGLLKARLRELGISADTPTDFIERAKGIVCSHNDLQKKKGGLEAEIRRLELDQENIITKKEKEILDAVLAQRSGVNNDANIAELRNMVKSEIKACLDGKLPAPRSGSPLPKVGSDVTLTKVPGPLSEVKQSNEVEIKKTENIGLPKVEMKFGGLEDKPRSEGSESLAFGKSKTMAAPRANDDYEDRFKKIITSELAKTGDKEKAKVTLSPTKPRADAEAPQQMRRPPSDGGRFDPRFQDPRSLSNGPGGRNGPVDSRFDSQRSSRPPGHDPRVFDPRSQDPRSVEMRQPLPDQQRFGNPRFVDNPHPRDGLALPREGYPPSRDGRPLSREAPMPRDGLPQSREAMVSLPRDGRPLSREAPMPRDGRPQSREAMVSLPRDGRPQSRETPTGLPRDRSFAQHISSEIERQMTADRGPPDSRPFLPQPPSSSSAGPVSSGPSMSSQNIMNMTVERAIQNSHVQSSVVARMSRVIEDSVRKDPVTEKKSIYAPNSRGNNGGRTEAGEVVMEGLAMPRGTASPGDRQKPSTSLPQVEGLAARFNTFFEKEEKGGRGQSSVTGPAEGLAARFSSPDPASAAALSRPNSTSSKSSLTLGNSEPGQAQETENRKRPGSPVTSPVPGET